MNGTVCVTVSHVNGANGKDVPDAITNGCAHEREVAVVQSRAPTHNRRCLALQEGVKEGIFTDLSPAAMFMDMDHIIRTLNQLTREAGFPPNTLHTVAVKANPVGGVLRIFKEYGVGAEVASFGELSQALEVGFSPDKVVFDSPAKTLTELKFALEKGLRINVDNMQELERVRGLVKQNPGIVQPGALLGVRVNPQVGTGSIAALSTGGQVSKFGVPLLEQREEVIAAFKDLPWLNALHLHTGSQGLATSMIVDGVVRVWGLLEEINQACGEKRIKVLDIGGGLTVNFDSDDAQRETKFAELARLLRAALPQLWEPGCCVQLVTENGRSLLAKHGFVASRVEYTKSSGGRAIAVNHVGADLLLRMALLPDQWKFRLFVCDAHGRSREADAATVWLHQDVAGPLCFQGDKLATNKFLPAIEVGDYVVVVDVGAYAISMYSKYNSRCCPGVYGYSIDRSGHVSLKCLRAPDTIQEVLAFWNKFSTD